LTARLNLLSTLTSNEGRQNRQVLHFFLEIFHTACNHDETVARQKNTDGGPGQALRTAALRYPEAEEGIACKGTAIECSAFKSRKKTFLFVGAADIRLKLRESIAEAAKLAAKEPGRYEVGALGWVKVKLSAGEQPPLDLLEKWIDESYRVVVDKRLVAMLPERGLPAVRKIANKRQ